MSRFDEIMLEHFGFNEITIREDARKEQKMEDEAIISRLQDEITQLKRLLAEQNIPVPADA